MNRYLLILMILLTYFNYNNVYGQVFVGKTFDEVYKTFQNYKGEKLDRFIQIDGDDLSYGRTNNLKNQKIVMFSTSFKNNYCYSETWCDIKTKQEAFNRLKKSIGSKRLLYLNSSEELGDRYLIEGWHTTLNAYIQYFDSPFKEYMVTLIERE